MCQRPDWCTWQEDGAACCMRVESDKPMANGGWLHKPDSSVPAQPIRRTVSPQEPRLTPSQCLDLWRAANAATTATWRERHAAQLGVSVESLTALGAVWSGQHQGWLWPMRNEAGTMTGLRVRTEAGDKWAVKGSTAGLFLPSLAPAARVYVVEGPTDTAALLTLGLYAVGRHACLGQENMTARYLQRIGARECVIVADADEPGQRGAEKLLAALPVPACIVTPPAKDIREALRNGITAAMVNSLVRSTRFTKGRQ